MQVGVLERDRQAQAGAAARAGPGGVGTPEAVEDHRGLPRPEADPVVADRDGRGLPVRADEDLDVTRLRVVDRVGDQVAHDPLHPAYVRLGDARRAGVVQHDTGVALRGERRGHVHHAPGDVDEVDVLRLEHGGAGVEAADLQQVGQQGLEAVELLLEQLCGASGDGVEEGPRVVDDVAGHAHRRDRRTELVGDVGDEAALQAAELLELPDLPLEVGGHLVEGRREPCEVVLAPHPQPLLEVAGRQSLGDAPRHPDRRHDLPGHQPGEAGDEEQQRDAGDEHGPRDQRQRLLLLGEGVEVVERVGVVVRRQPDLAAHHDAGALRQSGDLARGADVGVGPGGRRDGVEARLELLRHAAEVEALGELRASVGQAYALADRRRQHHGEAAGRTAGLDRLDERLLLRGLVHVEARLGGEPGAGRLGLALGLLHDRVDAVLEQAVAGLLDEEPPDDADDGGGQQHGADHDACLHRASPEGRPVAQDRRQPVEEPHRVTPGTCRPCSRRRGRSPRPPGSPGRARPWSAGAARGR